MKITTPTMKKLLVYYQEMAMIGRIKAVLDWDLNVNLPPKASQERAMQSAYLAEKTTKLWADEDFRKTLRLATLAQGKLSEEEQAIIRNMEHAGKFYLKVPSEIIIQKEKVASEAFMSWREAKEKNDYSIFLPSLKELIKIDQIIAKHLGFSENPYDALLDQYEPGLKARYVKETFDKLKPELVALVKKITKSKTYQKDSPLINSQQHYPRPEQERLGRFLMQKMGYDFQAGNVSVSPHPFTIELSRHDIRITTMYKDHDFRDAYTSFMHETGHALYEQGVNLAYENTPLEGGVSLGIHEALSRFWENMIGKNLGFLRFMMPIFQSSFPDQLYSVSEDEFIRLFHIVKPSFVRIEADEVTYSLHIILRFEMEHELISGKLDPKDAPARWRQKSKELFGIEPPTDSDGILQDVHWAYGSFGYFPAYAFGNLYGAQFLASIKKEVDVDEELRNGRLEKVHAWLKDNIHQYGSLYLPKDLVKKTTGKGLDYKHFVQYLNEKYSRLYKL